ncbi:MAG: hypothetical protein V4481_01330 [Patescibacteria group bacterium]
MKLLQSLGMALACAVLTQTNAADLTTQSRKKLPDLNFILPPPLQPKSGGNKTTSLSSSLSTTSIAPPGTGGSPSTNTVYVNTSPTTFTLPVFPYPAAPNCTSDPGVAYGVPPFSGNDWGTSYYNWDTSTTIFDALRPGEAVMSQSPGYYPASAQDSDLYSIIPLDRGTNGNPSWHSLKFYYQFSAARPGDQFLVGTTLDGTSWLSVTNLPNSGSWTRSTILLPPYEGSSTLLFHVHRAAGAAFTGPQAFIAALQMCKIDRYASQGDIVIRNSTNSTVVVAWNTVPYPAFRYELMNATTVGSNAFSLSSATVQHTGVTAYAVFLATNVARFFELHRIY